jgi:hypothetical protein
MTDQQTYDRLIPIINMIDNNVTCQSVTDNGDDTYTFLCSKTKWSLSGFEISILGNDYTITNVVYNTSITIRGTVLPVALTFNLYVPIFKHGTIKVVASELNKVTDYKERLPLIYLKEQTVERLHFDRFDSLDTECDVTLYFLSQADNANWSQADGDTKGIAPMRSLANEFIKVLADNQFVAELTNTGDLRNYNIFGNVSDNGVTKNIFNEPLCGVGLRINIPFLKECDCCEDSNLPSKMPAYVTDLYGNIIAVLYSNEYYPITVLTTISDTIDNNNSTIIENLN